MSPEITAPSPEQQALDSRWELAIDSIGPMMKAKYPGETLENQTAMEEAARQMLEGLASAPGLKFVETPLDDGNTLKTVEPLGSETHADGVPVEDLVSLLGGSESHVFASSDPNESWYLPSLSQMTGKPIEAYVIGQDTIHIDPSGQ